MTDIAEAEVTDLAEVEVTDPRSVCTREWRSRSEYAQSYCNLKLDIYIAGLTILTTAHSKSYAYLWNSGMIPMFALR